MSTSQTILYLSVLPTACILLLEHLVMKYVYHRRSALQRLCTKRLISGKLDLLFTLVHWIPFGIFKAGIKFLTLPGICYLALRWLDQRLPWEGLFTAEPFSIHGLNLLAWYLVFDFGHYLAHVLMHRIPGLWAIHRFHHSATEMTILTGVRVSFAEQAFTQVISFGLLTCCFGIPKPEWAVALIITRRIMELLQHSDLPWDYGWLGGVFVGPRFHRMHHSCDPQDYNSNYGNMFTFWDTLLGTRSKRHLESGSITADEVVLGLRSETEAQAFSTWYYALFHQTIFHYAWVIIKRLRPAEPDANSKPELAAQDKEQP